jgi:ABC-type glutathione transport system ATPase component
MEAELLLLDEPASSLDVEGQAALLGIIENACRRRGITDVMVSHNPDALKHCTMVHHFGAA